MKRLLCACLALSLLAGCGGSTTGARADAPAPAAGPCVATMVSKTLVGDRRSTWTQVGTLTLTSDDGKEMSSGELRDASGKSVPVDSPARGGEPGAMGKWVGAATCKVGGMFAFADEKKNLDPEKTRTLVFDLYRPTKDEPSRDLDDLCTRPAFIAKMTEGNDPSATMPLTASYYDETLSSRTWRVWHTSLSSQLTTASDDAARKSARVRAADELDRASKSAGKSSCWWAEQLRQ